MKETDLKIGKKIKSLRQQLNYTLNDVAKLCDFSVSLLSKIENDKVFPTAGTLIKISKALNTNIQSVLEEDTPASVIVTLKDKAESKLIQTEKGFHIFPYATEFKENKIHAFLYHATKGKIRTHKDSHEGQEFIFILEGTLGVRVNDTLHSLNPGDSIYFDSKEAHECVPISEESKYLIFFS